MTLDQLWHSGLGQKATVQEFGFSPDTRILRMAPSHLENRYDVQYVRFSTGYYGYVALSGNFKVKVQR